MKALILAGGFGTRLRPLSCTRPKLLFPIANKPLLDITLERLAENGVNEAVLAVNFMADALERACGKSKHGIKLHYSRDAPTKPKTAHLSQGALGTGGPIKQAEKLLGRKAPFFVLNGDILTDSNYSEIMKEHKKNNGIATIALRRVEDPSHYGVVKLTKKNRITRFVEKPSKKAPSNLANAGIYVLEPSILNYIPVGKRCSIEREIFPKLAKEGELFGHEIKGLWVDVGKPADYIKANRLWLEAGMETSSNSAKAKKGKKTEIKEAVAIGEGVSIGEKSIIGPNVSLGKKVSVGKEVHIKDSIIFPHTIISDLTTIEGVIIGESVIVGRKVKIGKGCLIGDNTVIRDNITLTHDVKICPSKEISENILTPRCVM
ncbi:MAG: NDP-sugar synthase [Candidatus Bathyarchaeota archaeon]|nr:NDP-sugar synthase [Candidatus Bathyarchaeota archaeon]MDH5494573.1 NDP-sugar synthase [Candidatus Bathyarchaeota archaeon]